VIAIPKGLTNIIRIIPIRIDIFDKHPSTRFKFGAEQKAPSQTNGIVTKDHQDQKKPIPTAVTVRIKGVKIVCVRKT